MTHRIQRLKAALFQNHREISLERALLYTASQSADGGRTGHFAPRQSERRISLNMLKFRFVTRS